jgi:hypothetical protein
MLRLAALAAIALLGGAPAPAESCGDLGDEISIRTNARIVKIEPTFGNVVFEHPAAARMVLLCGAPPQQILFEYKGAPDARFLALVLVAGSMAIGKRVSAQALADCIKESMIDPSSQGPQKDGGVQIECGFGGDEGDVLVMSEQD